jgi:integral membrane protein (TIGR01906 family)
MSGLPLATERPLARPVVASHGLLAGLLAVATVSVVLGAGFVAAANPWYLHGALDRAGSADWLGLPDEQVHAVSDATVAELFVGPGTFAQTITGPSGETVQFYGPSEAAHLRDAQLLARLLAAAVLASVAFLAFAAIRWRERAWAWRAVQRGAAAAGVGLAAVGVFFALAFEPALTLFHEVFFPQGNWSFDPREARMVQLYPEAFWNEVALVFAIAAIGAAAVLWIVAGARRRHEEP